MVVGYNILVLFFIVRIALVSAKRPSIVPTRFVRFADPYRTTAEKQCRSIAASGVGDLPKRPYAAMMFWTTRVHEHTGTNPSFPAFHRDALKESIKEDLQVLPSTRRMRRHSQADISPKKFGKNSNTKPNATMRSDRTKS
jgi:hypothetical protein